MKAGNPTDLHVGTCIRIQRMVRNMSQTELGKKIGVTFQQVQKYEKGVNCVDAGRLHRIANALKVAPDFFFDGTLTQALGNSGYKEMLIIQDFISSRDCFALSEAFTKIGDPKTRQSIVALIERIAHRRQRDL